MKKVLLILLVVLPFFCVAEKGDVILQAEPCEFEKIELYNGWGKSIISAEELAADIENLCYILSTGYAGYDGMVQRGFNADAFKERVTVECAGLSEITSRAFFNSLVKNLEPFVYDAHFRLLNFMQNASLCKKSIVLWSDVFAEKRDDSFVIKESSVSGVKPGMVYAGSSENLFYYPLHGTETYRLGVLSAKNI